jgi:hypothetical protein
MHGVQVIFAEATTHGSLPWTAQHDRRALLYKFSPGNSAYSGGIGEVKYPEWMDEMAEAQREVLLKPAIRRAKI